MFGAFSASVIANRNKRLRLTIMRISVVMTNLLAITLFTVVQLSIDTKTMLILVPILCILLGFFGYTTYPLGLNFASECAMSSASEATCNGLIIISGYLQGAFYMIVIVALSEDNIISDVPCTY